jgi:hypothetical protein
LAASFLWWSWRPEKSQRYYRKQPDDENGGNGTGGYFGFFILDGHSTPQLAAPFI